MHALDKNGSTFPSMAAPGLHKTDFPAPAGVVRNGAADGPTPLEVRGKAFRMAAMRPVRRLAKPRNVRISEDHRRR